MAIMKIRLYCTSITPKEGLPESGLWLTREQHHYVHKVLRLKPGREIFLFNAHEGEWVATVTQISSKGSYVEQLRQVRPGLDRTQQHEIIIYFSPIKRARLGTIFAMGCELGATLFRPIQSRFTQHPLPKLSRIEGQLIEASEQCERLDVPAIEPLRTFATMLHELEDSDLASFAALERGSTQTLPHALQGLVHNNARHTHTCKIAFIIGPEGGWHDDEILALQQHAIGFSLGPRILRSETAVATVLAQYHATKHLAQ